VTEKPLTKIESQLSEKSSSKPSSTADAEIFIVQRLLLPHKPLTRTRTLGRKNHQRSQVLRLKMMFFCAHRLQLTEKLLTKTESLLFEKSSSKPSSIADAEIFIVNRLLLPHKPLTRTRTPKSKNHTRSQVLRLTLTSSAHIDYW